MPRHYLYRMDHDTGFAPHVWRGICTLCGCKRTTVERWAERGSWVFGIGGAGTERPDRLIYALRVDDTPTYAEFLRSHPTHAEYLRGHRIARRARVLIARDEYYYFGDAALEVPPALEHLILRRQGCRRLSDDDVSLVRSVVLRGWRPGRHGEPNNPPARRRAC